MIDEYHFGRIIVKGNVYTSDVVIYPDRVDAAWWREEGHLLVPEDLEKIVKTKPDTLVVGIGSPGLMKVPTSTREWIESHNIKLIIEPTEQACKIYNQLCTSRRVVAAFHLTC